MSSEQFSLTNRSHANPIAVNPKINLVQMIYNQMRNDGTLTTHLDQYFEAGSSNSSSSGVQTFRLQNPSNANHVYMLIITPPQQQQQLQLPQQLVDNSNSLLPDRTDDLEDIFSRLTKIDVSLLKGNSVADYHVVRTIYEHLVYGGPKMNYLLPKGVSAPRFVVRKFDLTDQNGCLVEIILYMPCQTGKSVEMAMIAWCSFFICGVLPIQLIRCAGGKVEGEKSARNAIDDLNARVDSILQNSFPNMHQEERKRFQLLCRFEAERVIIEPEQNTMDGQVLINLYNTTQLKKLGEGIKSKQRYCEARLVEKLSSLGEDKWQVEVASDSKILAGKIIEVKKRNVVSPKRNKKANWYASIRKGDHVKVRLTVEQRQIKCLVKNFFDRGLSTGPPEDRKARISLIVDEADLTTSNAGRNGNKGERATYTSEYKNLEKAAARPPTISETDEESADDDGDDDDDDEDMINNSPSAVMRARLQRRGLMAYVNQTYLVTSTPKSLFLCSSAGPDGNKCWICDQSIDDKMERWQCARIGRLSQGCKYPLFFDLFFDSISTRSTRILIFITLSNVFHIFSFFLYLILINYKCKSFFVSLLLYFFLQSLGGASFHKNCVHELADHSTSQLNDPRFGNEWNGWGAASNLLQDPNTKSLHNCPHCVSVEARISPEDENADENEDSHSDQENDSTSSSSSSSSSPPSSPSTPLSNVRTSFVNDTVDCSIIARVIASTPTSLLKLGPANTIRKLEPRIYIGDIAKNSLLYSEHPQQRGRERPNSIKRMEMAERPPTDRVTMRAALKVVLVSRYETDSTLQHFYSDSEDFESHLREQEKKSQAERQERLFIRGMPESWYFKTNCKGSIRLHYPTKKHRSDWDQAIIELAQKTCEKEKSQMNSRTGVLADANNLKIILQHMYEDSEAEYRHLLVASTQTTRLTEQTKIQNFVLKECNEIQMDAVTATFNCKAIDVRFTDSLREFDDGQVAKELDAIAKKLLGEKYKAEAVKITEKGFSMLCKKGHLTIEMLYQACKNVALPELSRRLTRVIVIGGKIIGRGVSFHSMDHSRMLTDMFYGCNVEGHKVVTSHGEMTVQMVGRLEGVYTMANPPTVRLWASKSVHDIHKVYIQDIRSSIMQVKDHKSYEILRSEPRQVTGYKKNGTPNYLRSTRPKGVKSELRVHAKINMKKRGLLERTCIPYAPKIYNDIDKAYDKYIKRSQRPGGQRLLAIVRIVSVDFEDFAKLKGFPGFGDGGEPFWTENKQSSFDQGERVVSWEGQTRFPKSFKWNPEVDVYNKECYKDQKYFIKWCLNNGVLKQSNKKRSHSLTEGDADAANEDADGDVVMLAIDQADLNSAFVEYIKPLQRVSGFSGSNKMSTVLIPVHDFNKFNDLKNCDAFFEGQEQFWSSKKQDVFNRRTSPKLRWQSAKFFRQPEWQGEGSSTTITDEEVKNENIYTHQKEFIKWMLENRVVKYKHRMSNKRARHENEKKKEDGSKTSSTSSSSSSSSGGNEVEL